MTTGYWEMREFWHCWSKYSLNRLYQILPLAHPEKTSTTTQNDNDDTEWALPGICLKELQKTTGEKKLPGQPVTEPGFESGALEHEAGALSTRSWRQVLLILLFTNTVYHHTVSKSEMVAKCHEVWHQWYNFRVLHCLEPLDIRTDQTRW